MNEAPDRKPDRYAGDEAWRKWFEMCAVSRCDPQTAQALSGQIRASMFAQLARFGFPASDVGSDDPVARFDSYFMLKGSRDRRKPLKQYFAYRMQLDGQPMRGFVCGTLFSSVAGRVHDIVRDWIASVKGWKARAILQRDGTRRVTWECAAVADDASTTSGAVSFRPAARLDRAALRLVASNMFNAVAAKCSTEPAKVALLFLATAEDIAITAPPLLDALGVGKSRAYELKDSCMRAAAEFFNGSEIGFDDPLLAEAMLDAAERTVPAATLNQLRGRGGVS